MEYDPAALEGVSMRFRRDMWRTAPDDAVIESGVELRGFGPIQATAFAELPAVPRVNIVQGAAEPEAVDGGHLADAIEWMRSREVDYRVPVASALPAAGKAAQWLSEHGYERGEGWEKLVRDTSPPNLPEPPGIEIIELAPGEGEGMDTIAPAGMGLPDLAGLLFFDLPALENWRCYVALLRGELVACGSMLIDNGIAELGIDSTLEAARGWGCNKALLRRRLIDAAAAGCHTVFAELDECGPEGTDAARRNLFRAGFEEAYASQNWRRPSGIAPC